MTIHHLYYGQILQIIIVDHSFVCTPTVAYLVRAVAYS